MAVEITITGLERLEHKYGKSAVDYAVKQSMESTVVYTEGRVKAHLGGHVKTGRLRSSIHGELNGMDGKISIGSGLAYGKWVDEGTGIYGPHAREIVPKHAQRMVWQTTTATGRGTGGFAVAKKTRGQPAVHFIKKTVDEDRRKIATHFGNTFIRLLTG